ncbi:class II glutamine amidotransferase [uncultured Propionivibrio sp.]|uniref:class II glutamine amidotransferase n=1 Tax=uncultured Propionivibrio sp. TaxID=426737 RepID=UPI0029C05E71|nr:class II glutamine amidotransferase [uncultured Propionivibrio sp.]
MCELLGMNCNVPTDICFSFSGFQARGGATDVHRDGWGIAFFEGKGARVFLDPQPSCDSPVAELVRRYPIRSLNTIAHIRKATQGATGLENTHPFMRELWGRYWIFAHNGNLIDYAPALDGSFLPVGQTDSERAFCHLLQRLRQRFPQTMPAADALLAALEEFSAETRRFGSFNFLLSNGERLFAHRATELHYLVRQAPFSVAHLKDEDLSIDFNEVTTPNDRVALIATQPLTDNECWQPLPTDRVSMFCDGTLVS